MKLTAKQLATLQRIRKDADAIWDTVDSEQEPDAYQELGGIVARAEDLIARHHSVIAFEKSKLPSVDALIRGLESFSRQLEKNAAKAKKGEA